jgi:5-oxoprolinase (ATP-hydrolysing) subunit A
MKSLDLNADIGEGMGNDAALLEIISSASISCGGHAGTDDTMRAALRGAKARDVIAGYHPGFADPENFGRVRLSIGVDELVRQLRVQFDRLGELAASESVTLRYVKLHGALANMAAEDESIASVCFAAARNHDASLAVLAIDNSAQVSAAEALGLEVVREAYADRAYQSNGLLVPRSEPGAVIHDPERIARRAVILANDAEISAVDGTVIKSAARSLCLHGDTEGAVSIARHMHDLLTAAGIAIAPALAATSRSQS